MVWGCCEVDGGNRAAAPTVCFFRWSGVNKRREKINNETMGWLAVIELNGIDLKVYFLWFLCTNEIEWEIMWVHDNTSTDILYMLDVLNVWLEVYWQETKKRGDGFFLFGCWVLTARKGEKKKAWVVFGRNKKEEEKDGLLASWCFLNWEEKCQHDSFVCKFGWGRIKSSQFVYHIYLHMINLCIWNCLWEWDMKRGEEEAGCNSQFKCIICALIRNM